jgi:hypothetical protein
MKSLTALVLGLSLMQGVTSCNSSYSDLEKKREAESRRIIDSVEQAQYANNATAQFYIDGMQAYKKGVVKSAVLDSNEVDINGAKTQIVFYYVRAMFNDSTINCVVTNSADVSPSDLNIEKGDSIFLDVGNIFNVYDADKVPIKAMQGLFVPADKVVVKKNYTALLK